MKEQLITILLPCRNAERYLVETLDSLINQTYANIEIICIDDGSTDKTPDILQQYSFKDQRIRFYQNEKNIKLIATLNRGIALAQGEYIARIDADDIALPDRIERQLLFIKKSNADLVSGSVIVIDENGKELEVIKPRGYTHNVIEWLALFSNPMGHPSVFGKTDVFKKNNYLQSEVALHAEDYEIWARMIRNGVKMANTDDILIKYRVNPQSVSMQFTEIQNLNFARCVQIHFNQFCNLNINLQVAKIIANRFSSNIVDFKDIVLVFSYISKAKTSFIKRCDSLTRQEEKIIKRIAIEQKIDILIQFYKQPRIKNKALSAIYFLLLLIKAPITIVGSKYLKEKFFSKYNRAIKKTVKSQKQE